MPVRTKKGDPNKGLINQRQSKRMSIIKEAPYFADKNFSLYLGDSLKIMAQIPDDSVDMIFADPPYNLSNGGFTVHAGKRVSVHKGDWDVSKGTLEDFNFHLKWIQACKRILKPAGTIWVSGTYHSIYACGYALQFAGYKILNDITWFKPNASPNLSGRYFAAAHETLIWARKDPEARHYFDYEAMKKDDWFEHDDQIKKENKQMRSVWRINTPRPDEKIFGKHPTQKPLTLLRRIVKASSKEGDLILDPFTGSSTTGIAAVEANRKFIGLDLEKEYLDLSIKRCRDLLSQGHLTL
jgi:site-specific DNA-methyltransferase (adenine-specific)